jgi:glyoxylase-like metal-dependent hydrolase (beta-lactamase superfamily II)
VNGGSQSEPNPTNKRRDLALIAGLIEHPTEGLILFETGCAEDLQIVGIMVATCVCLANQNKAWPAPATDLFPRTLYDAEHRLPAAIAATGNRIKDVTAVIMGHLHLDHAGGLEHFMNTAVPVYVSEEEFKYACWAVATKADSAVYLANYLDLERINWQTFTGDRVDLFPGITLHHTPGHTPGLCAMQINLQQDGTFIWTTDQYHVKEHYEQSHPQGWLARDHAAWIRSSQLIKRLQRIFDATLIFGHDKEVVEQLRVRNQYFQ